MLIIYFCFIRRGALGRWDTRFRIIRDIPIDELCEFSNIVWRKKREGEFSWQAVFDAIQLSSTQFPSISRMQLTQLRQIWASLLITRARAPGDDSDADKLVHLYVSLIS